MTDVTEVTSASPHGLVFSSLDQLLTEESAAPYGGKAANPNGYSVESPIARVERLREVAATSEITLSALLGALGDLIGEEVLLRIKAQVSALEDLVHALSDVAVEAEHERRAASEAATFALARGNRARAAAVLLEGALEAARERERRVQGVVDEGSVDGHELAARIQLALDFDADADPLVDASTPPTTPAPTPAAPETVEF